jgi:hypothetical protein
VLNVLQCIIKHGWKRFTSSKKKSKKKTEVNYKGICSIFYAANTIASQRSVFWRN